MLWNQVGALRDWARDELVVIVFGVLQAGNHALRYAACQGRRDDVKLLVDLGAEPTLADEVGLLRCWAVAENAMLRKAGR